MEDLDALYEENIEGSNRLKRAKKGLTKIIQRAMLNKLTRFLCVLLILVVIGLAVVVILRDNGVIQVWQRLSVLKWEQSKLYCFKSNFSHEFNKNFNVRIG